MSLKINISIIFEIWLLSKGCIVCQSNSFMSDIMFPKKSVYDENTVSDQN